VSPVRAVDPDVLTVHARIALGLLAAEHVLPLLAGEPKAHDALQQALADDWSWMETRRPDPSHLYWDHMPALMEEDSRLDEADPALPVLHCGLYAHSYAIWSAEGVTNLEAPGTVLSIGNDIAEVDESYLTQCLDLAAQVSPRPDATTEWLNGLIERFEREQRKTEDDLVGARLRRAEFDVPPLDSPG
jgi:hypothetical protein